MSYQEAIALVLAGLLLARTLLVALAFRAIESQRPDAMLSDPRAVCLIEQFDESFLLLARKMDMDQIFTVMRARQFDTYTRSFLAGHPAALRKKYGLKPGANVNVVDYGGVLALVPVFKGPVREGAGILKGGDSLTRLIVEGHHHELE